LNRGKIQKTIELIAYSEQASGADGVKIAVLRKGHASLV